ncbi:MAG TPA: hypothetical protein VFS21_12365 [Roseiflexaceae bacterium]|nr:hypothetical protein [Roseiflexaceae bacterium]
MEKSEIQDALEHQHKMARVLRERLQQRELQEAQYGIDTPPQVLTEIQELTERIAGHDAEIARLQTLAVEEQLPLAAADYRASLADEWQRGGGQLPIGAVARLELRRLQLGVPSELAQSLAAEVRAGLARDALAELSQKDLGDLFAGYTQDIGTYLDTLALGQEAIGYERIARLLRQIATAIAYDPDTAAAALLPLIAADELLPAKEIEAILLRYARFYPFQYDQGLFARFLGHVGG